METLVLRSFKLPLALDESLAAHAVERGVTKSDLVRELLRRGLEGEQSTSDIPRVMARLEKLDTLDTLVEKLSVLESMKEKLGILERVERKLGSVATAVTSLTELIKPTSRGARGALEVLQGRRAR